MRANSRAAQGVTRAGLYLVASIVLAVIIVPIAYAVLGGFRDTRSWPAIRSGSRARESPRTTRASSGSESFWRQLVNSTLIAILTTLVVLPAASLAALAIARFSFRGREPVYTLFTLGLPSIAVAILPPSS